MPTVVASSLPHKEDWGASTSLLHDEGYLSCGWRPPIFGVPKNPRFFFPLVWGIVNTRAGAAQKVSPSRWSGCHKTPAWVVSFPRTNAVLVNREKFSRGVTPGGIVSPLGNQIFTPCFKRVILPFQSAARDKLLSPLRGNTPVHKRGNLPSCWFF